MKKLLAVTLVVMLMMASGLAQSTPGYVPVYSDASGDLVKSVLFQSGTNIGIETITPLAALHVSSAPPAMFVDSYSGAPTTKLGALPLVNRGARGTQTSPSAVQAGDYLGGLGARGFGTSQFSNGWRAAILLKADQNWTDTAQGTNIGFGVTAPNTTAQTIAMTLTSGGALGVGTQTPGALLEVNGTAKFDGLVTFASGQTFPGAGVSITSPDNSITVGGTAIAPTVAVTPGTFQKPLSGACPAGTALTAVSANGTVTCGIIGTGGTVASVPVIVAQTSFTGSYGLGTPNSIYTADEDAFYRVSVYMNVATMGTCSSAPCAGEAITVQWNDGVSATALATANCNLVTPCGSSVVTPMWVQSGQAITAYGQSYGAGAAPTGGGYNAYLLVEKLKK